jgi:peptidoglycan/xylan/chitin deacetylase (PgdA/CDA1 family)
MTVSRRQMLGLAFGGVAGAATLAACSGSQPQQPQSAQTPDTTTSTPPTSTAPPSTSDTPKGPVTPHEVVRADTGRPQVALTFHGAGDVTLARKVLDLLKQKQARVTVLAVGTWLQASPDAARMVTDEGHELGNHTWSHPALSSLAPAPMLAEIERCRDKLVELTGSPGAFFRQSQGQHATAAELAQAGKAGYATVLSYDIDSLDWQDPGPAAIRKAVAKATAGSVISMHLGHPGTLTALPMILTDLTERGLTPVTATDLLR